ncbi:MAG: hypothetical protein GDA40_07550 [Rhodobacteraceae bacterium]|nr:hypothetical protein [Paracoccaceae bacterium]
MDRSPHDFKQLIAPFRDALYDFDPTRALTAMEKAAAPDVTIRMCTPFPTYAAPNPFFKDTYLDLAHVMPDLECRDGIRIAGTSQNGQPWVGIMGNVIGTFAQPFLDIPPTSQLAHMRYREFHRFEGTRSPKSTPSGTFTNRCTRPAYGLWRPRSDANGVSPGPCLWTGYRIVRLMPPSRPNRLRSSKA